MSLLCIVGITGVNIGAFIYSTLKRECADCVFDSLQHALKSSPILWAFTIGYGDIQHLAISAPQTMKCNIWDKLVLFQTRVLPFVPKNNFFVEDGMNVVLD